MKVSVDANILFACLVRNSETRRLWFNSDFSLYAPQFIIYEFLNHQKEMLGKSRNTPAEFEELLEKVLVQLTLVSDEELKPYILPVSTLGVEEKDWVYFACALKENSILWSQDAEFKKQKRIIVKNTKELLEEFGGI